MNIERSGSTERMSKVVKHNGTIYLCGQTASDSDWDIIEQTQRCLDKVDELLAQEGSTRDRILSVTIYLRDMKDFSSMNKVWDSWVADGEKPARACVEARMARPDILVELSVIAAI